MSKQSSRKPSPSTVRPPSPRIVDPRKHSPRASVPVMRNRKSPSLFEPNSSFTDRVSMSSSLQMGGTGPNLRPKPMRNSGLLDDIDLLSQSAFFDEADSEIQSIYERVVKDSSVQSSLQEIIAAQKLQAAYALSQSQLRSSSSPPQSQSMPNVLAGTTQGSYRGVSSSSSSFFTASHFVVPHPQTASQYTDSISSPYALRSHGQVGGVNGEKGVGGQGGVTGMGVTGMGVNITGVEAVRLSLDEDQKSDNTTPAGYMLVDNVSEEPSVFSDFVLPQPESMSDDALIALVEFANKEMWKRNHPPAPQGGQGKIVHEKRKSSPSIFGHTGGKIAATQGTGGRGLVVTQAHRRPRSKSGGSESALTGREEGVSQQSTPRQMGSVSVYGMDDYPDAFNSARSVTSFGDECGSNDSGRVRPVEKMLGLTPGYLKKPSPASSPAHFLHGVPKAGNSRSSPWLVFDPPLNQGNMSPVQHGSQSPHIHMGRPLASPNNTSCSPSRSLYSSSPICIGSSGSAVGTAGGGGGPIRLPAKKVTSVPVTLFSPEEHGEKRRKGDYFTLGYRHDDDDSHSFVSLTSSIGSGLDKDIMSNSPLQQQLQQLVISPRTAFDDISVSSSEGSSSSRKGGYRKAPVPGAIIGKQKR